MGPHAAVAEVTVGSFAIASMALEEGSGGTPSQVYGRGTEDTRVEARVIGGNAIRKIRSPFLLMCSVSLG